MSAQYRTKVGENLDWICWHYYIQEVSLGGVAMAVDPRLLENKSILETGFLLNPQTDATIRGAVEMVLQANPGLAAYPLSLPAGLNILLPDFTRELVENDSVKLWD